jgi:DNA-binding transcriptional LysR family regulator
MRYPYDRWSRHQPAARGAALQTDFCSVDVYWAWLIGPDGEQTIAVNGVLYSNNGEVLRATVRGLGITLLSEFIVEQELQQGTLQICKLLINERTQHGIANLEATCFSASTLGN